MLDRMGHQMRNRSIVDFTRPTIQMGINEVMNRRARKEAPDEGFYFLVVFSEEQWCWIRENDPVFSRLNTNLD